MKLILQASSTCRQHPIHEPGISSVILRWPKLPKPFLQFFLSPVLFWLCPHILALIICRKVFQVLAPRHKDCLDGRLSLGSLILLAFKQLSKSSRLLVLLCGRLHKWRCDDIRDDYGNDVCEFVLWVLFSRMPEFSAPRSVFCCCSFWNGISGCLRFSVERYGIVLDLYVLILDGHPDELLIQEFWCAIVVDIPWRSYNVCCKWGSIVWQNANLWALAIDGKSFESVRKCLVVCAMVWNLKFVFQSDRRQTPLGIILLNGFTRSRCCRDCIIRLVKLGVRRVLWSLHEVMGKCVKTQSHWRQRESRIGSHRTHLSQYLARNNVAGEWWLSCKVGDVLTPKADFLMLVPYSPASTICVDRHRFVARHEQEIALQHSLGELAYSAERLENSASSS